MIDQPYRFRVISRQPQQPRDPRYLYDPLGRREYAGGLTQREAARLVSLARNVDAVVEEHLGQFEGMDLWATYRQTK